MLMRRRTWLAACSLAALVGGLAATSGPPPPAQNRPGTFSFAALGDAPYYAWEAVRYRIALRDLDAHDLRWVLHVGDIFWRPCSEDMYQRSLGWFNRLRHPVVYTPGDNEWTDCWEPGSGGFAPQDRLNRVRQIFFHDATRSLGGRPLRVASQAGGGAFPEFVENARWAHAGIVFATVHLVGSMNGLEPFPQRTHADDESAARRLEAAVAWLRETFAEAAAAGSTAVVIAFHANPALEAPADDSERRPFDSLLSALEKEVERFPGPVLVVHGDGHVYTVDHPLVRRTTGQRLDRFTRLQVPGSPEIGWVRIVVAPGPTPSFAFEPRIVPWWKYW